LSPCVSVRVQVGILLDLSAATRWTAAVLLKRLIVEQVECSVSLVTIVASATLAAKYEDASTSPVDYVLLAQHFQLEHAQLIHVSRSSLVARCSADRRPLLSL
jgi:hypothetical protein